MRGQRVARGDTEGVRGVTFVTFRLSTRVGAAGGGANRGGL